MSAIPEDWLTILGIDPGLSETGWGVIMVHDRKSLEKFVASGRVRTNAHEDYALRLQRIFREMLEVIDRYSPSLVAIEEVFVNRNPSATLKLCHGRAASMIAAAHRNLPVQEFHNRTIKNTIVGKGNADKHQMQTMIGYLLPDMDTTNEHEIDALCIALCAHQHRNSIIAKVAG